MAVSKEFIENIDLQSQKKWLVTGAAGFIGSNLVETLLSMNQIVIGLDSFITGSKKNLEEVKNSVENKMWDNFYFTEGSILDMEVCSSVCRDVDYVLHQAALGSVPRSIENPFKTNDTNISGFLNILHASMDANVKSFTFAASSSTYGDHMALPKIEDRIGKPLSPYAVTKYVNELYSDVFSLCYGFHSNGLRYFNVFGARQDPFGAYAAVIPKWANAIMNNEDIFINGDGTTSRDFCFVDNIVLANILAARNKNIETSQIFNIACGDRTSLLDLFYLMRDEFKLNNVNYLKEPIYKDFRDGDVKHSQADINKAKDLLNYKPIHSIQSGMKLAIPWYIKNRNK